MYSINNLYEFETIDEVDSFLRENIGVWLPDDDFDRFINDTNDKISIFDVEYDPALVFYKVDEDSYNIAYNEYINNAIELITNTLEEAEDGYINKDTGYYEILKVAD